MSHPDDPSVATQTQSPSATPTVVPTAEYGYPGTSFSAPLPIVDATPASTVRPRRRLRGLFWVAVLGSVAVLVAGLVTAVITYLDEGKAGGVVQRYFSALSSGDAAAALGFGQVPAGSRTMLTEPVLKAQLARGHIGNVAVLAESAVGSETDVDVQYTLTASEGPMTVTDTIAMVPSGRTWRLKSTAVPVQVAFSGAANRITVAGAMAPMGRQLMFPGAAPFAFDTKNLELAPQSAVIRFAEMPSPLDVQLSGVGKRAVEASLDKAFNACIGGSAPTPAVCPAPSDTRAVPGTFKGVASKPASANANLSVNESVDGVVQENATVPVTGTYSQLDFNNLPHLKQFTGSMVLTAQALAGAPARVVWDNP
ncbi:hypothetical protein SAMN05892883_1297 [Jatrophihabitans sp. GAS493]|uniref:hypothetical protein n=1 Tax=Jatrophihabitans sp. GAS493 TaxID=1907575 RepID=UPI000BB99799|nr:hypothetical protein [Jatrophihabitans sp. GAS493]SOD71830.1 hypothetical protein SAMN05892883_1297 [Jatrophihabitans sp. GAS493]